MIPDTRQHILHIALQLFSQSGFSAVSIRDICKEVGIKESTVYYHFKNKQDILDSLVLNFTATANHMNRQLAMGFKNTVPAKMEDESFLQVSKLYYSAFLNDEYIFRFIGMLMIEQRNNVALGKLLGQLLFEQPIETQSDYFALLMEWGYLRRCPVRDLATVYQSIVYFCYCRQIALGQTAQEGEQALVSQLTFFLNQYKEESA